MPGEGWGDPCELCPKEEEGTRLKSKIFLVGEKEEHVGVVLFGH